MGIKFNSKKGKWEAFYSKRHPITRQSRQLRRQFKNEREAIRGEKQIIAELERKLLEAVVPRWDTHLRAFISYLRERGFSEHTIHDYQCHLEAYTLNTWGSLRLNEISTEMIRLHVLDSTKGKSIGHTKNIFKFIRAAFEYGLECGHITRNPTPKFRTKQRERNAKVLTEEQAKLLLQKAKAFGSEWYPHWLLALYTGMRNGELYALTWDKVSLEDLLIKVDCSWNSKDGFKDTKSGDERIIPIHKDELLPFLKKLKLENGLSNFVLPRLDQWDRGSQAKELKCFLIGIGLPPVRFHDLRASWATMLLSKGVEPAKVMRMGGWKDIKTMMIYIRKAGIDVCGATDILSIHNPISEPGSVVDLHARG